MSRRYVIGKPGRSVQYAETPAESVQKTENRSKGNLPETGTLDPADSAAGIKGLLRFHPRDRHHVL
jgi:hypothetical protein